MPTGQTRLVADIGGTNSRLALYDPASGELRAVRQYLNREYAHLEDIIANWLAQLDASAPIECCLAIAAPPPLHDVVTMLNINWRFSVRELAERFGFSHMRCINDFESNAFALPHLSDSELAPLNTMAATSGGILATVGPGTGLGGATLDLRGAVPVARASEPGHMGLSPVTERERAIVDHLVPELGEVYAESLLSGPGLQRLYATLAALDGHDAPALSAEEISSRGMNRQCALCTEALEVFCALLGSACGDFALANGAYGGLYVAGGIAPQILECMRESDFAGRFQAKGKMQGHLAEIPLYLVTSEVTGLLGAAHTPL